MAVIAIVDRFDVSGAAGWAYDSSESNHPLLVTATHNGDLIGCAVARDFRADVKAAGHGTGAYAFSISFEPPIKESDTATIALTAWTSNFAERKILDLPALTFGAIGHSVSQDERLKLQVKVLLKYGMLFANSNPVIPPVNTPADFSEHPDLMSSNEVNYYLSKINAELSEVQDALRRDTNPIPHSQNREGYAPGRDLAYWISGYTEYRIIQRAAAQYGVVGGRYFDFGGSTGRVFRHFGIQTTMWDVWSCDFKPTSVDFVTKYLPGNVRSFLNTSLPSLPLPDGYFDLISACSVFTHINEMESSWLLELRRMLRVGGIACITILNDASWPEMDENLHRALEKFRPDIANEKALPEGKTVITFRDDDPYNCNVFHSDSYILDNWGRFFEICEIRSRYLNTQAMVICRRLS